jgi:fructosamine-3-kinase
VARAARDEGRLPDAAFERVRALAADLDALLCEPEPALLHGDVWRGNLRVDGDRVTFLDPACYFGHDELDLAYADWTETFGEAFRERYRERRGVDDGYEERRPVYQLYPLLEHVRYFGAADYLDPVRERLAALGY